MTKNDDGWTPGDVKPDALTTGTNIYQFLCEAKRWTMMKGWVKMPNCCVDGSCIPNMVGATEDEGDCI